MVTAWNAPLIRLFDFSLDILKENFSLFNYLAQYWLFNDIRLLIQIAYKFWPQKNRNSMKQNCIASN